MLRRQGRASFDARRDRRRRDARGGGMSGQTLTRETIVPFLASIFERRGAEEYLGEPVTIAEHMLQGAALAEAEGAGDELVAAALLHDIGHFTSEFGTYSPDDTEDKHHD